MEDENKDLSTSEDTQEDTQEEESTEEGEELAQLKEEVAKLKKAKSDQEQRAKIAEDKLKSAKTQTQSPSKKDDLTMLEAMTLMKNNVNEEDIESVKRFAKLENISIAEALKNDELKAVLHVREEKRKTAEATSTGRTPRGKSEVSDEVIIARASKGEIPDANTSDAEKLFWARRGGKK